MSFFHSLLQRLKPAAAPSAPVRRALDRVAAIIDPQMRQAGGYEKKLAGPVQKTLEYCDSLVASLPGPVTIDRQSFSSDPLVHAFFATADDVARVIGGDPAVRKYLASLESFESDGFYAMLAARRQSKKTLGVALEGEMVRGDVAIEYLFFSDHTLTAPAPTLERAREGLRTAAFESLLKSFKVHLKTLREERQTLRGDRDVERDRLNLLRNSAGEPEMDAHTRRLNALDERLRQIGDLLQPEHLVDALVDFLAHPDSALRLEPFSVTLDRSGAIALDQAIGVETLEFRQIVGRDRRRHAALLVHVRREDAAQAMEQAREQRQRYLMI